MIIDYTRRVKDWGTGVRRSLREGLPRRAPRPPREPVEIEAPRPQIVESFTTLSKWSGIAAILIGYHGLVAWAFDIDILRTPGAGFLPITAACAACSLLCGAALLALRKAGAEDRRRRTVALIMAGASAVLAAAALAVVLYGLGYGFGFFVGERLPNAEEQVVTSAVAFLIASAALILAGIGRSRDAEFACLVPATMSLLAIAGYIYGAKVFRGQMPLYAAVSVLFLSGGTMSLRADEGFMNKITSNSFGGLMARRLLPATLLIPLTLGWLQHEGQHAGLYSPDPGLAFFSIANIFAFVAVVWWGVNSLYRMDTKRRQAERGLEDTAAKLRRSNADLEQFAYVASHDLKEPLRAISGSIQVFRAQFQDKVGKEADDVINHTVEGAARMQALIDDLLTYSRLTTSEGPMESTDCEPVLVEALRNLETAVKDSGAVVTTGKLPTVKANRTELLQVFQNLVSNALKYRSERTPKIHVDAEDRGREWVISVRDNGIGIAPQYVDRIFRIFQRLHTRREYPGTGIGLAVCKKIVERHGGRIWVESELEEGSTFYFTLPK